MDVSSYSIILTMFRSLIAMLSFRVYPFPIMWKKRKAMAPHFSPSLYIAHFLSYSKVFRSALLQICYPPQTTVFVIRSTYTEHPVHCIRVLLPRDVVRSSKLSEWDAFNLRIAAEAQNGNINIKMMFGPADERRSVCMGVLGWTDCQKREKYKQQRRNNIATATDTATGLIFILHDRKINKAY